MAAPHPRPASSRRAVPVRRALLAAGALVAWSTGAGGLAAQDLQTGPLLEPLVPSGHLRLGVTPSFTSWDSRFGLREEGGATVEGEEPLSDDLTRSSAATLFPGVAFLEEDLAALTELSDPALTLGSTRGAVTQNVTRVDFSAHLGVFDWLTVGATLPWVKTRTAVDLYFRSAEGANLGLSPTIDDNEAVSAYVGALSEAATAARARAEGLCSGGGEGCGSAQALADRAEAFAAAAQRMYFGSPVFLLAESDAAAALAAASEALAADLAAAGLVAPGAPIFATTVVDGESFRDLVSAPAAGIQGAPLGSVDGLWSAGDLEVEATVRLLDGEIRDSGAVAPRLAWTLAGGGLVRLGTGTRDDPDVFLDLGTGDGQTDLEGFGYGALRVGSRLGLRAMARYGIQRSTSLLRRVAGPDALLPPASTRRVVEWSPGSYVDLLVSPRIHVSETLTLAGDWRVFDKGADTYRILGGAEAAGGADASLLELETARGFQQLGVGLRYSTLRLWRRGGTGAPVEASARVVWTVSGSGGRTPKAARAEVGLRLFRDLWGG